MYVSLDPTCTPRGWRSGSAFVSDAKGRGFKSRTPWNFTFCPLSFESMRWFWVVAGARYGVMILPILPHAWLSHMNITKRHYRSLVVQMQNTGGIKRRKIWKKYRERGTTKFGLVICIVIRSMRLYYILEWICHHHHHHHHQSTTTYYPRCLSRFYISMTLIYYLPKQTFRSSSYL